MFESTGEVSSCHCNCMAVIATAWLSLVEHVYTHTESCCIVLSQCVY